jgi:hypothetical protein
MTLSVVEPIEIPLRMAFEGALMIEHQKRDISYIYCMQKL